MENTPPYLFKTPQEQRKIAASTVAAASIFGVGAALVLNPLTLGAAGLYTAGRFLHSKLAKSHDLPLARKDEPIQQIAKEVSDSLGRSESPKVYLMSKDDVAADFLPHGFGWVAKAPLLKKIVENIMPNIFSAILGTNKIVTTREALDKYGSERELRFISAHEISHLENDNSRTINTIEKVLGAAAPAVLVATATSVVLGVPMALPVLPALSLLGVSKLASTFALNAGTRIQERRADRNAIFVTRDLPGARMVMKNIYLSELPVGPVLERVVDLCSKHPGGLSRMRALSKDFELVSQYSIPTPETPATDRVRATASANLSPTV